MSVYLLNDELVFPSPLEAEEDGLLCIGGDLNPDRLLLAYEKGIFPWYSEGDPIMWFSPDPRCVLYPHQVHISHSMKQVIHKRELKVTFDHNFNGVISGCAQTHRPGQAGTWIVPEMKEAYITLHHLGMAHSIEVWQDDQLVGGLYGVSIGRVFFGESMFSLVSNASKLAFITMAIELHSRNFKLIDCQLPTNHLHSLGATDIPRIQYLRELKQGLTKPSDIGSWNQWI